MKVTGIIAEFDPFHNGHKHIVDYARKYLKSDYIIAAMTGDFTQRGTPAIMDKYDRADIALHEGVDLVIEIPSIPATSSAEYFAEGGFYTLRNTGILTDLVFGAETPGITLFEKAARLLNDEPELMSNEIKMHMRAGDSYPKAFSKAIQTFTNEKKYGELLSSPNNLLGLQYMRILLKAKANILPHSISRTFVNHHERKIDMNFTSSTNIREGVKKADIEKFSDTMPEYSYNKLIEKYNANELIFEDDISQILHMKLYEKKKFDKIADINTDISNRILNIRDEFVTYSSFKELLTTKNLTASRIARCLNHIFLDMEESDREAIREAHFCPYLHILGFTEHGKELLSPMKKRALVPFFVEYSEAKSFRNKSFIHSIKQDLYCSDLYRIMLTNKTHRFFPRETNRKFEVIK